MEQRQCLVSVLCTAYNHEKYLRDALESFVTQRTDFAFEVLVTDDASTDGTADIIREYAAKYPDIIRPFYHERNLYSQGIDIYHTLLYPCARGKYVALCEGDDYWTDPMKLQLQADFLEAHPNYSACVHNTMLHYCAGDKADRPLLRRYGSGDGDVLFRDVAKGVSYCFHTSAIMAVKDIIADAQEYYHVGRAYAFTDHPEAIRLMFSGPIWYIDRCMSVYRINSGALSWSSGVDWSYDKLREYVDGERLMLEKAVAYAPPQYKGILRQEVLEKEFELMYIEGRDAEQRALPYRAILERQPLKYRAVNLLKCSFPHLSRLYRQRKGYGSGEERMKQAESPECLVSVFCTAYNHEKYIRDALEGIVSQRTDFPFELLINDDVSTDGTADIIREYAAKYPDIIRPFYQERNLYSQDIDIYQTVFYPNARGKYVAFCEGDDYWTDPLKLQLQADFLEAHPEYSGCVHNTRLLYCADGNMDALLLAPGPDRDIRMEDVIPGMRNAYHTSSLMGKTELLKNPPEFYYVASEYGFGDYPDALWLLLHGPVRCLDRCMSVYRINSGESAWSSGVDWQYDKLKRFVVGRHAMMESFKSFAPEEYLPLVEQTMLEQEFELMYIEGRDREQRRPPYRDILRKKPLDYRFKNTLKCVFPGLHRLYRRRRGYEDY